MGLKEGERYLTLTIGGKDGLRFAVFKNKKKEKDTEPDYIGSLPIGCWINEKKGDIKIKVEHI